MDGLLVPVSGIVFKYLILCNERSVIFPIISQTFFSHPMCHIFDFLFKDSYTYTQLSLQLHLAGFSVDSTMINNDN